MVLSPRVASSVFVSPLRTTNKLPSTIFAMTFASVTAKTGGVSRIMKSYNVFACSNTSFIRRDASNSDGLGGIGPQDKTSRKSTPEVSTACSKGDSPIRTLDKPVKLQIGRAH